MKKIGNLVCRFLIRHRTKLIIMRNTLLIVLISSLQVFAVDSYAQTKKISLDFKNATIKEVLNAIEKQSEFYFLFNSELIDVSKKVDITVQEEKVADILIRLFKNSEVNFLIKDRYIVLTPAGRSSGKTFNLLAQQQGTVSGRVTDQNNQPLPGVTIVVKGTTQGTITDNNGGYSLTNLPTNATLAFTFIGMRSQEVKIGGQTIINVRLEEELFELDEVVAIGYGTLKREELTSAVASVRPDEMNIDAGAGTDIARVMQGKVAGLTITRPGGGNPNQDFEIRLRGTTSISAGQSPLIVVDGVPGGNLSTINPHDIKSIDILKDASAAAIYGTRGTNGVIVIQTKSGETLDDGVNVILSSQFFTETVARETKMLSRDEYLQLKEEIKNTHPEQSSAMIDYGYDTDWFDEIQRDITLNHQQNLAILGKGKNTSYRISGSYFKHDGLFIETGRQDYKVNLNLIQHALNDMLILQAQMGIRESTAKPMSTFPYMMAMAYNPTQPVYVEGDPDKGFYQQFGMYSYQNPVAELKLPTQANKSGSYYTRIHSQLKPTNNLTLTALFSNQTGRNMNGNYVPSTAYAEINVNRYGTATRSSSQSISRLMETTIDWDKYFGDHRINIIGGYSYQDFDSESMSATNYNFISDSFTYHNLGAGSYLGDGRASLNSSKSESKLVGFFARSIYNWNNRYFLSASIRREGSSKFGSANKWGYFPAASIGWTVTNENFAKNINWLDFFKLRLGYGKTGNQDIGNYIPLIRLSTSGYFFYNGQFIQGYAPISNANPNLKWETKHEFDLGFDWIIFNGRLGGNVDWYTRKTIDLLHDYDVPVPPNLYSSTFANVASMSNQGIELTFNIIPIKKENFQWNLDLTFDYRTQKILSLSSDLYKLEYRDIGSNFFPGSALTHAYTHRYAEGMNVGNFYGYKCEGIDEDGKWIFKDFNDDGVINFDDNTIIGNGLPKYYTNLNTSFSFKNWNLSAMFRSQLGHQILNTKRLLYGSIMRLPRTLIRDYDKNLYDTQEYSDYYLEPGDWVKIDNITLSYMVPLRNDDLIKNIKIYTTGSNLITLTRSKVNEPEVSISGLTPGVSQVYDYPSVRSFMVGFEIGF